MIKRSYLIILSCFVMCAVNSQEFTVYNYQELDSAKWIRDASGLIVTGTEGAEMIKLQVQYTDPGKIEFIPTSLFPDKYICSRNEASITDTFIFDNNIKQFRPEIITKADSEETLGITFELNRKFSFFDLTGILAIRHLIPKTETLLITEK